MKLAYADPPYPGQAHQYRHYPDYAGEVDYEELIASLVRNYDGWALSLGMPDLQTILPMCPDKVRVLAWVKPGTMPQDHHPEVMYGWEPVIVSPARRPADYIRDVLICPSLSGRQGKSFLGAKPELFCFWLFRCLGALPDDDLADVYPGSGAVTRAWQKYQAQMVLPVLKVRQTEKLW